MKVNGKQVKTKNVTSTKDIKEILLAKLSIKQAIIVAIISLVSAVAVTVIANLDKIRNTKNVVSEERGYYEGRASNVEHAFCEVEEEVRDYEKLYDEVRKNHERFQELHIKSIDAILEGKRLEASKAKTDINELIRETNRRIEELEREIGKLRKNVPKPKFRLIPNYGKQFLNIRKQIYYS